ncbi:hypothetical protein P029_04895 [Anaplasma phagocytophilum str. Norway variant2]|uniref:Msp4/OMP-like domain-containing protein n=1 Tax=Anaplasma phagocytophilum str. Norway variant2 TaxID=1392507 RepID=A0A161IRJ9_ANAPH|nr:hypothetical protein P029_04895 [Anaplasma phagocytophilum str. Norway variant2]
MVVLMCFSGVPLLGRLSENLLLYFHSIIREEEVDTVYLLAKELAYDVVTDQAKRLGDALARYKGKDIVHFGKTLGISHDKISEKICKTKKKPDDGVKYATYGEKTNNAASGENIVAVCGAAASTANTKGVNTEETLKEFIEKTLKDEKNWPMSQAEKEEGKKHPKPETNDNAKAVAKDLVEKLSPDEKTIVAGLLAKTIEGGEVVEIRAVSSTSVMVNACYDLLSEGLGVVPYACVGLGGNFVGVVDGHITPKLAYRLKAGLSYQLSPEISAFAGGFYHRVVGDGVYDDLPAQLP